MYTTEQIQEKIKNWFETRKQWASIFDGTPQDDININQLFEGWSNFLDLTQKIAAITESWQMQFSDSAQKFLDDLYQRFSCNDAKEQECLISTLYFKAALQHLLTGQGALPTATPYDKQLQLSEALVLEKIPVFFIIKRHMEIQPERKILFPLLLAKLNKQQPPYNYVEYKKLWSPLIILKKICTIKQDDLTAIDTLPLNASLIIRETEKNKAYTKAEQLIQQTIVNQHKLEIAEADIKQMAKASVEFYHPYGFTYIGDELLNIAKGYIDNLFEIRQPEKASEIKCADTVDAFETFEAFEAFSKLIVQKRDNYQKAILDLKYAKVDREQGKKNLDFAKQTLVNIMLGKPEFYQDDYSKAMGTAIRDPLKKEEIELRKLIDIEVRRLIDGNYTSFALLNFETEEVIQLQSLLPNEWTKIKALKPSESNDYKKLSFTFEETDQLKEKLENINSSEAKSLSAKLVSNALVETEKQQLKLLEEKIDVIASCRKEANKHLSAYKKQMLKNKLQEIDALPKAEHRNPQPFDQADFRNKTTAAIKNCISKQLVENPVINEHYWGHNLAAKIYKAIYKVCAFFKIDATKWHRTKEHKVAESISNTLDDVINSKAASKAAPAA